MPRHPSRTTSLPRAEGQGPHSITLLDAQSHVELLYVLGKPVPAPSSSRPPSGTPPPGRSSDCWAMVSSTWDSCALWKSSIRAVEQWRPTCSPCRHETQAASRWPVPRGTIVRTSQAIPSPSSSRVPRGTPAPACNAEFWSMASPTGDSCTPTRAVEQRRSAWPPRVGMKGGLRGR